MEIGSNYQASGKVDSGKFVIFLLIAVALNGLLGILFGVISHYNPLIYINFLVLFGIMFASIFVSSFCLSAAKSRNPMANMVFLLICAIYLLYNSWAATLAANYSGLEYTAGLLFQVSIDDITEFISLRQISIGKFGRDGAVLEGSILAIIYLIEAGIIIIWPTYIGFTSRGYYCENCDTELNEQGFYVPAESLLDLDNQKKSGRFDNLSSIPPVLESELANYTTKRSLAMINHHSCPSCDLEIIDLTLGKIKIDKDNDSEFKEQETIVKGLIARTDLKTAESFDGGSGNSSDA